MENSLNLILEKNEKCIENVSKHKHNLVDKE